VNHPFRTSIQGVTGMPNRSDFDVSCIDVAPMPKRSDAYSAAAASNAFAFADETMKSEIRGTISDLKRDPLKTP
jgi:hypothetical protein